MILSSLAILIAIFSLVVSITTSRFNKAVKSAELMTNVLTKSIDATSHVFQLREFFDAARKKAEEFNDIQMYKSFDTDLASELYRQVESLQKKFSSISPGHGLKLYESVFHELSNINVQIASLEAKAKRTYGEHIARIEAAACN